MGNTHVHLLGGLQATPQVGSAEVWAVAAAGMGAGARALWADCSARAYQVAMRLYDITIYCIILHYIIVCYILFYSILQVEGRGRQGSIHGTWLLARSICHEL